jgi:hypothetical protein
MFSGFDTLETIAVTKVVFARSTRYGATKDAN